MEVVRGRLKHAALVETTKGCYLIQNVDYGLYSQFGFGTTGLG